MYRHCTNVYLNRTDTVPSLVGFDICTHGVKFTFNCGTVRLLVRSHSFTHPWPYESNASMMDTLTHTGNIVGTAMLLTFKRQTCVSRS